MRAIISSTSFPLTTSCGARISSSCVDTNHPRRHHEFKFNFNFNAASRAFCMPSTNSPVEMILSRPIFSRFFLVATSPRLYCNRVSNDDSSSR